MTEETPLLPPHEPTKLLAPPAKKSHLGLICLIVLAVFTVLAVIGIVMRIGDESDLKKRTDKSAIQTVSVMTVQQGSPTQELVLPGTIQAWHEAIVYARTAGYIKDWKSDIGAQVKEGDVLANIDAPDLDAQFHQAQADLQTSIANNNIAQLTAKRYVELRKTDSVSQQQADNALATAAADEATVESSKANLDHLQQQENFKQIVAPFDGTISQRNADVGTLINGGNSASTDPSTSTVTGQDVFHISDISKLRIYVQVPENYASFIKADLKAELHFPEHPQTVVMATLDHTADRLDPINRTLLTQFEVDNADGKLFAGGYTDVHITIGTAHDTVMLPVNTLLFRDGMQAGVVGSDNHVTLKSVTIGRDFGKSVEIVAGVSAGDIVVVNPPDSLQNGQEVKPQSIDKKKDDGDKSKDSGDKPKDDSGKSKDDSGKKDKGDKSKDESGKS